MLALLAGAQAALAEVPSPTAAMLPERTLQCVLGRATNLDATKDQTTDDIVYEGRHPFTVFLPAIPVRTGPPPEAVDPAEPVDPRTRILADPDGLTREFPPHFDRVVDYWPDRVEMTTVINDPLVNLIIIHPIDPAQGTASIFMTQATDVATFDMQHIYQGTCSVAIGSSKKGDGKRLSSR
jgi:hypothetical protein